MEPVRRPVARIPALVAALGACALCATAGAGFLGWQASVRSAGAGRTYVDLFAGFGSAGDRLLNVFNMNVSFTGGAGFMQSGAAGATRWKPQDDVSSDDVLDSFVTLGSFDGGDGRRYSSYQTQADPNFTNYATAGATSIPANAGWYTALPTSADVVSEALVGSAYASWVAADSQGAAATRQVWIAHFLVDRDITDLWTLTIAGSAAFNGGTNAFDSRTLVGGLAAPAGVVASDGTFVDRVQVQWSAVAGASAYDVFRDGDPSPLQAGVAGLSFADTSALPGIQHSYAVRAVRGAVSSAASAADGGYRSVAAPAGVAASDGTFIDSVRVTWTPVDGAVGYEVFRNGVSAGTAVGASFIDLGAVPGTPYAFTVRASGVVGTGAASAADTGYRMLAAPDPVAASDGTGTAAVTVTWAASAGATGYRVYRDGAPTPIATLGAVGSHADAGVVPGTSHSYTVTATTTTCESAPSAADTGFRNLSPPAAVSAGDGAAIDRVTVTWTASTGATGYVVGRSVGGGVPAVIATLGAVTTLADLDVVPGTAYAYTVRATTDVATSAASAADTGFANVAAPAGITASDGTSVGKVVVGWSGVAGATSYRVFRGGVQVGTASGTGFEDTGAVPGTQCAYSVRALGAAAGCVGAASASDTGWANRAAPLGVSASDATRARVRVTWAALPGARIAKGYEVYRSIGTGAPQLIATTGAGARKYDDRAIAPGVVARYWVRARFLLAGATPAQLVATGDSASDTGVRPVAFTGEGEPGGVGEGDRGDPTEGVGIDPGAGGAVVAAEDDPGASAPDDGDAGDPGDGSAAGGIGADRYIEVAFRLAARIESLGARVDAAGAAVDPADRALLDGLRSLLEPVPVARSGWEGPGGDAPGAAESAGQGSGDGPVQAAVFAMLDGDVDLSGTVDGSDLAAFVVAWSVGDQLPADLDRDGWLSDQDVDLMVRAFLCWIH